MKTRAEFEAQERVSLAAYAQKTGRYKLLGKAEDNGRDQYLVEAGEFSSVGSVAVYDVFEFGLLTQLFGDFKSVLPW